MSEIVTQSEQLLETLLDLERSRQREQALRVESMALLNGLQAIAEAQDIEELFYVLIDVLRSLVKFQDAFILTTCDDGTMVPAVSTSEALKSTTWKPESLFRRVLAGKPAAVFDIELVPEWAGLPEVACKGIKSALHVRLSSGENAAILTCVHSEAHYFSPTHVKRLRRFIPLASQAFLTLDLRRAIMQRDRFFKLSIELMAIADFDGYLKQFNSAWHKTLGYTDERLKKESFFQLIHADDRQQFMAALQRQTESGEPIEMECRFCSSEGRYRWLSWRIVAYPDEHLYYIAGRDVTDRVLAEECLRKDARHDPLTGLFNRAVFMERLTQAIDHARRQPLFKFAVLYLDLDRFKLINDSLGHLVGDQLLVEVAKRLQNTVRAADTIARLGGDEFIVLLSDLGEPSDAGRLAQRILERLSIPMVLEGHEVSTSSSIGITFSSLGYKSGEDLLRDADIAMYAAKMAGKSRYMVFDQEMHAKAVAQLQLEMDIRYAIEHKGFILHYQPIVDLKSGAIVSFEALVRWRHPTRGFISPLEFIPVAEESGLIVQIGQWVLEEACEKIRAWRDGFPQYRDMTIHVNISGRQFWQKSFVDDVVRTLDKIGLAPEAIVLEVTESIIMHNTAEAIELFKDLKETGIRLYIDDFGTGYSSLSYLHRFPIDGLKIDRSFIARMEDDAKSRVLVNTILLLGRNIGINVVAEGVETKLQSNYLLENDCRLAQGYLFSKPLAAEAAATLLASD